MAIVVVYRREYMSTNFEDIKQLIVEAQLASTPQEKMISEMTNGMSNLLSADDIIECLCITTDEFKELVNLPNHELRYPTNAILLAYYNSKLVNARIELVNRDLEGESTFPKPDLYILGKARWKKETFLYLHYF